MTMKCKKAKNLAILHLYGELGEKEKAEVSRHLEECRNCSQDFEYTKKIFELLNKNKPAEAPETEWEKSWKKIESSLARKPFRIKRYFISFPRWAYGVVALLLVFLIGIFIGKFAFLPARPSAPQPRLSQNSFQLTLNEHLEDLKPILLDYANYTPSQNKEQKILIDEAIVRGLVIQNILLKRMLAEKNPVASELLDDLDLVLKEIAHGQTNGQQTPSLVQELIRQRGILFKMQILKKT